MGYSKTWNEMYLAYGNKFVLASQNGPGPSGSVTFAVNALPQFKSGQTNAEWKKRIAAGDFVASPYSRTFTRIFFTVPAKLYGRGSTANGQSWASQQISGFGSNPSVPAHLTSLDKVTIDNRALSRILEKLRKEQEHISLLPALGELRSTIRQFGAPAEALLSLTNRHINKLELAARGLSGSVAFKRIQYHKIVASTYLEWTFGLSPLIDDTRKVAEALARWKAEKEDELPRPTNTFFTANAKATAASSYLGPANVIISSADFFKGREVNKTTTEYGCRYAVSVGNSLQADFGSNDRLLQLLGFKGLNFIPTIWEVIPWSWLIDYFLNVQQIIEAGVTDTTNVKGIVRTTRERTLSETNLLVVPSSNGYPVFSFQGDPHLGRWKAERLSLIRTVPASLGLPMPVLSYPNSIRKLANASAALFARRANAAPLWLF